MTLEKKVSYEGVDVCGDEFFAEVKGEEVYVGLRVGSYLCLSREDARELGRALIYLASRED